MQVGLVTVVTMVTVGRQCAAVQVGLVTVGSVLTDPYLQ